MGVIEDQCGKLGVPYLSCRGFTSQSAMWTAAQRMNDHLNKGQRPKIIHLGDHDPSGIDMSRDIRDRLDLFLTGECWEYGEDWEFERIALSMDQIRQFDPPSDPTKMTDSRSRGYQQKYGDESWELDALEPETMNGLIRSAVYQLIDGDKWGAAQEREKSHRQAMKDAVTKLNL